MTLPPARGALPALTGRLRAGLQSARQRMEALSARAPLFWRLLGTLVLVSVLTAAPIFYVSFLFNRDSTERRAEQNLAQQISILAQNFEQEYRIAPQRSLKQIATSEIFAQMLSGPRDEKLLNAKALETLFFGIAKEHARYSGMSFIDSAGREISGIFDRSRTGRPDGPSITADAPAAGEPAATAHKRKLFERIRTAPALLTSGNMEWFMPPRDMIVEGPFYDERGRKSVIAGLGTLDADSGAFAGVLMIQLNLDPFMELLRTVRFFDENPIWVFASSGEILLEPESKAATLVPSGHLPASIAREAAFVRTDDGLFAYRDLTLSNDNPLLRLVYAIPTDLVLKDLSTARDFFILAMLISALVVLGLAYVVSRSISTPIVKLVDAASRLSRGDLSARVQAPAGGELRVLIEAFNTMSGKLEQSNESRAEAMAALRRTAALMQRGSPSESQTPAAPGLDDTWGSYQSDTEDLRRISELIAQLISEREQRLGELRDAIRAADNANRAKGDFLATMSHEIRTPLNAVIGLAGELGASELSPAQLRLVTTMESAGNQLLEIVNDILDFSRLQSGHIELKEDIVETHALVERLMLIIRGLPNAMRLDIRSRVHPEVPGLIITDGSRLMQVLTNLLGNAVKFTQHGSVELDIAVETGIDGAPLLRASVTDTGPGIPENLRANLFEPFRQGQANRLAPQPGTGLGLAISQRIAQAMGGRIELDASLEEGARFVLRVPLRVADSGPASQPQAKPEPAEKRSLRILVAEDTPANQLVIQLLLKRMGHSPVTVDDGEQAVNAFSREPFDLVLLDIQMPVMNGLDAARAIRGSGEHGRTIPIVALTAFTQGADRQNAFDAGMDAFVSKPVRADEIARVIDEVMKAGPRGPLAQPAAHGAH